MIAHVAQLGRGFSPAVSGGIGAAPSAPSVTTSLSGTTLTVTIDGDAGATNYVYYQQLSASAWTSGGSRSGDGNVTISGLVAGVTYVVVVVSKTTAGGYSLPSDAKEITVAESSSTVEFDDQLSEDADIFLSIFGQAITYYPRGGGSRAIVGIVDQEQVSGIPGVPGANTPPARITVKNSATDGISSTEIDTGGDKIGYSVRIGQAAQSRRIGKIISQDHGMLTLEVY